MASRNSKKNTVSAAATFRQFKEEEDPEPTASIETYIKELLYPDYNSYIKSLVHNKLRLKQITSIIQKYKEEELSDILIDINSLITDLLSIYSTDFIIYLSNKDLDDLQYILFTVHTHLYNFVTDNKIKENEIFNIETDNSQRCVFKEMKLFLVTKLLEKLDKQYKLVALIEQYEYGEKQKIISELEHPFRKTAEKYIPFLINHELNKIYKLDLQLRTLLNDPTLFGSDKIIELKDEIIRLEEKLLNKIKRGQDLYRTNDNLTKLQTHTQSQSQITDLSIYINLCLQKYVRDIYILYELRCDKKITNLQFNTLIKLIYRLLYLRLEIKEKEADEEYYKFDSDRKKEMTSFIQIAYEQISEMATLYTNYGIEKKKHEHSQIHSINEQIHFLLAQIDLEKSHDPQIEHLTFLKTKLETLYSTDDFYTLTKILSPSAKNSKNEQSLKHTALTELTIKRDMMADTLREIEDLDPSSASCKKRLSRKNLNLNHIADMVGIEKLQNYMDYRHNYMDYRHNYILYSLINDRISMVYSHLIYFEQNKYKIKDYYNHKSENSILNDIRSRLNIISILKKRKQAQKNDKIDIVKALTSKLYLALDDNVIKYNPQISTVFDSLNTNGQYVNDKTNAMYSETVNGFIRQLYLDDESESTKGGAAKRKNLSIRMGLNVKKNRSRKGSLSLTKKVFNKKKM
jgi:hypothetical protein